MRIISAVADYFGENSYLLYDESTRQAVLVDPGSQVPALDQVIENEKLDVKDIVLTHAHIDHISGIAYYRKKYATTLWMAEEEKPVLQDMFRKYPQILVDPSAYEPDHFFQDGDVVSVLDLSVMATPGHTVGSVVLCKDTDCLTGDTLFEGSVGRTDLYTGDLGALRTSIRRLFGQPVDYTFYPGHGNPGKLSQERSNNPYVIEFLR